MHAEISLKQQVFREANTTADWVATFVEHSRDILWIDIRAPLRPLHEIMFSDHFGCVHTRLA